MTARTPSGTRARRNIRVLVVDDFVDGRELLVDMLEAEGFAPLQAQSAAEAYAVASIHRPELILMDAKMPGEDGYAAARRFRAEPVTRNVPIVMVTADTSEESVEHAFAAGCAAHITKPIERTQLVTVIEGVLFKQGPRSSKRSPR